MLHILGISNTLHCLEVEDALIFDDGLRVSPQFVMPTAEKYIKRYQDSATSTSSGSYVGPVTSDIEEHRSVYENASNMSDSESGDFDLGISTCSDICGSTLRANLTRSLAGSTQALETRSSQTIESEATSDSPHAIHVPIICVADVPNTIPLVLSALCQRQVLRITTPVIVISYCQDSETCYVILGWVDDLGADGPVCALFLAINLQRLITNILAHAFVLATLPHCNGQQQFAALSI